MYREKKRKFLFVFLMASADLMNLRISYIVTKLIIPHASLKSARVLASPCARSDDYSVGIVSGGVIINQSPKSP